MKILLIEDDADVRESVVQTLEDPDFLVDTAATGTEGLYRASEWTYDVIVMDVMLPELDGWEILEQLKMKQVQTPVLMLTALDSVDDRVRGLEAGADDYLGKPFSERELNARIRALYRRSLGHSTNQIDLGAVEIDTERQQVFLHGDRINLTAAQYRITVYLALRAGQVIPRRELEEATQVDENGTSNVIDVQIYHIRRKLGKHVIQSRRGLGFFFQET